MTLEINTNHSETGFVGGGEVGALMRARFASATDDADGLQTALGAVETWSQSLKLTLNILLNACSPMFLLWGHDRILFYNDAYGSLAQRGHYPTQLGEPVGAVNGNWQLLRSDIDQVFETGQPRQRDNLALTDQEDDRATPCYTWSFTPIGQEAGQVEGVLASGCRVWVEESQSEPDDRTSPPLEETLIRREELLQLITNAIPALISYVDKDHYYRFANQAYVDWFGTLPSEPINKHVREFLGEAAYQAVLPHMKQALSGQRVSFESQIPYRLGGSRYVYVEYVPHINQQGEVEGYFSLVTDITQREEIEQARRKAEERLRVALQNAPITVFNQDHELKYTWIYNPILYTLHEMLGKHDRDYLPPGDAEPLTAIKQRVLDSGIGVREEIKITRGETDYYYDLTVEPLRDGGDTIIGITCAAIDISDRKQTEMALLAQEQRYRYIFEATNVSIWEEDFSDVKAAIDQLKAIGVQDFRQYFTDHPEFVQQAIGMVHLRDVNQRSLQLFGAQDKAELLNSLDRIFVPETQTIFVEELLAIAAERSDFAAETVLQTLQGDRFPVWVAITFPPVSASYERVLVSLLDIRDRVRMEAALRESEDRYRTFAHAVAQLMWVNDAKGNIEFYNQRWQEYTGIDALELDVGLWSEIIHPDDFQATSATRIKAIQAGEAYEVECRLKRADQTYRWHLARIVPSKDEQGQILYWFGTATDIDDRKRAEQEREQLLLQAQAAKEAAETANRIKDEFLAVVSHELRTPLNPILGWAKLLRSHQLDEQKIKYALEVIERNAQMQAQLINDLLDVSRILRGKLNLNHNPVNLVSIIQSATETIQLAAEAKVIELRFEVNGQIVNERSERGVAPFLAPAPIQVMGDPSRLQQIVWNLLSNAVKFTAPGGRVVVKLETDELPTLNSEGSDATQPPTLNSPFQQSCAQITVTDTGKGIHPDFLPYVFDHFRQEDSATTRRFGGLGLGLAIVRYLVELHGGTVQAASPGEGLGATFMIRLPLLVNRESRIENRGDTANSALPSLPAQLTGLRILVVDDDTSTREFLAFLLELHGADVIAVTTAREAIATLTQFKLDILLSDIGMPDTDGYMLIQQIRTLPPEQGGTIPAIALTAYAGEIDHRQAISAGFQRHLIKPIEPQVLLQTILELSEGNPSIEERQKASNL